MFFNQLLHLVGIGIVDFYVDSILSPYFLHEFISLLWKSTGIQGDDPYLRVDSPGHIQKNHPIYLKTGNQRQSRMKFLESPSEDFCWFLVVELNGQFADF